MTFPIRKSNTEPPQVGVLWVDDHLIVVDKPAGLPVQPDRSGDPSLLDVVRALYPDPDRFLPELAHRVDRPVSGAVLLARTHQALAALNEMFRAGGVRKEYLAIVEGAVAEDAELHHWIQHDARAHRARIGAEMKPGMKEVRLRYRSVSIGERYSLLGVIPDGGHFHQIRAQLAATGHPIKGDVKYGARRGEKDRSIALHAHELAFIHPVTHTEIRVVSPAPSTPIWSALLAGARAPAGHPGTG